MKFLILELVLHMLNIKKNNIYSIQEKVVVYSYCDALLVNCIVHSFHIYIYIYVWKLNQTVLELDFRAVKFLFFPRQDLNLVEWSDAGRKAKRMVLQCINGVGSNPVEGRTKIWQL